MKKILLFISLVCLGENLSSQVLDGTFGNGGIVLSGFGASESIYKMVQLPEGKILATGSYNAGSGLEVIIARYHPDGTLDTAFGTAGYALFGVSSESYMVSDIELLPGGNILLAGVVDLGAEQNVFLMLFSGTGTYLGDVKVTYAPGYSYQVKDVLLNSDGTILIAGNGGELNFNGFLARFLSDGELDVSFADNGFQWIGSAEFSFNVEKAKLDAVGKVLLSGSVFNNLTSANDLFIGRILPNGTVDLSFNGTGFNMLDFQQAGDVYSTEILEDFVILPDGKIRAAGSVEKNDYLNVDFLLVGFNADGTLDTGFGNSGSQVWDYNSSLNQISEIHLLNNGELLLSGNQTQSGGTASDFMLSKVNQTGDLMTAFGANGYFLQMVGSQSNFPQCNTTIIQNDGKFLMGGMTLNGVGNDFAMIRVIDETLSIDENHKTETKIYPNPASEMVFIQSEENIRQIHIKNLTGQIVRTIQEQNIQVVDVSKFPDGIYIIEMMNSNGKSSIHKLIIK